jgi:hypothetical protein
MPTTRLILNLVIPHPALAIIPAFLAARDKLLRFLLLGLRQSAYVIWANARLPLLDVFLAETGLLVTGMGGGVLGAFCGGKLRGGAAVIVG